MRVGRLRDVAQPAEPLLPKLGCVPRAESRPVNGRPVLARASLPNALRGRAHARPVAERVALWTLFVCTLLAGFSAVAQGSLPVPKAGDDEWKELGTTPPAYPVPAALVKFPTSWTAHEVLIDSVSLNIAADTVVRYTLVIKTAGGAENVTYEGIRCETGQRRVYAYGRRDGTWAVARNADWQPIVDTRANRHYFEFWRDLFCDGKATETRTSILRDLPRGGRTRQ